MIYELAQQLRTALIGNATLVGLANGVFLSRAPQGQAYPYITYFPVVEGAIPLHGSNYVEDTTWQFDIWTTSLVGLSSTFKEIKATFDGQTLALNTLTQVGIVRQNGLPLETDHVEEIGPVHHQAIEYQIIVV